MDSALLPGEPETDPQPDLTVAHWGSGLGFGYGRMIEQQFRRLEREIIIAADRGTISSKDECRLLHRLAAIDVLYDGSRERGLNELECIAIVEKFREIRCDLSLWANRKDRLARTLHLRSIG